MRISPIQSRILRRDKNSRRTLVTLVVFKVKLLPTVVDHHFKKSKVKVGANFHPIALKRIVTLDILEPSQCILHLFSGTEIIPSYETLL